MNETGIDKCHPPYLLAIAQHEGCGQEDIARTMHIDKGRIAKVTKDLISEGYVRREQNENDKRGYCLYLTEKGKRVFPQLGKLERDFEEMITKGMSDDERRMFRDLTTRAAMNVLEAEGLPKPPFVSECGGDHCGGPCGDHAGIQDSSHGNGHCGDHAGIQDSSHGNGHCGDHAGIQDSSHGNDHFGDHAGSHCGGQTESTCSRVTERREDDK
jgi:DNA-binding MarR family transcriptional regulator